VLTMDRNDKEKSSASNSRRVALLKANSDSTYFTLNGAGPDRAHCYVLRNGRQSNLSEEQIQATDIKLAEIFVKNPNMSGFGPKAGQDKNHCVDLFLYQPSSSSPSSSLVQNNDLNIDSLPTSSKGSTHIQQLETSSSPRINSSPLKQSNLSDKVVKLSPARPINKLSSQMPSCPPSSPTRLSLISKEPTWNPLENKMTLDFGGGIQPTPSVKNIQLVSKDDASNVFLQCYKIRGEDFCLDFKYPLSGLQAIAIIVAIFEGQRGLIKL